MFDKIRSVAGGVIFLLLCAGGALAMPASFDNKAEPETSAVVAEPEADLELEDVAVEGETTDVTVPDDEDQGEGKDPKDPAKPAKPENHGKAVSVAAHCPLTGRAKGELRSSVARDKEATAQSARAACDAALAAEALEPTSRKAKSKPARAPKAARPDAATKPPKPAKATKPANAQAPEAEEPAAAPAPTGPPAGAGPPAGKGNDKKP